MTDSEVELRREIEEIINWTCYRSKDNPQSIEKAVHRILTLIAHHDRAVLQTVTDTELEEIRKALKP